MKFAGLANSKTYILKEKNMKANLRILLLALLCLTMAFSFVACGDNASSQSSSQSESESKNEESSSRQELTSYTVTFHYGVKTWDAEGNCVTEYVTTKTETTTGKKVSAPSSSKAKTTGYKFLGWSTEDYKKTITENLEVYALYEPLEVHTVTFVNYLGDTIRTAEVFDGDRIAKEDIPDTNGFFLYEAAYYNKLSEAEKANFVVYPSNNAYYIEAADEARITNTIALPFGTLFSTWVSSNIDISINNNITEDVTFTIGQPTPADGIIPKVDAGSINIDGQIDAGYGEKMGGLYKYVISEKITGGKNIDCSILDKYPTKELAEADGKGADWQSAYDSFHIGGNVDGTLYMAWDGDFIYFCAEIDDDVVVSQGKDYCSIDNPYENDGVEIWYAINGRYSKLCLDAMGYHLYVGSGSPSQYLNYLSENKMYKTSVKGATIDPTNEQPRVIEGATGYIVEYALPAYNEPTVEINADNPLGATPGSANWGEKLRRGDRVYISLQVDSVSAVADQQAIMDSVQSGSSKLAANSSSETNKAMKRFNLGWQSQASVGVGTLTLILG